MAASAVTHWGGSPTVPWPLVWDSWPPLSLALPDQPPPPDHLENHLIRVDSIKMIPLACPRMSLERLVGTHKFPSTLVTLHCNYGAKLVICISVLKVSIVLLKGFCGLLY
jgi:hypothetical protein